MRNFYDLSIILNNVNNLREYNHTYIIYKYCSLKTGTILRHKSENSLSLKEMNKNNGKKIKLIPVNDLFRGDK